MLNDTLENQLPKQPTTARKSQKQIGKFGALTTKDAVHYVYERNKTANKRSDEAVNNKKNPGIHSEMPCVWMPTHGNMTVPNTPIGPVQMSSIAYYIAYLGSVVVKYR